MRRRLILALLLTAMPLVAPAQELRLPSKPGSVKFVVIGDTGEPSGGQIAIARQMISWRGRFPFEFALMMGDNLYGSEAARDYDKKFASPYKALLDGGVKFYAALGNHDDAAQIQYKAFNMNGQKYYSFKPQNGVRFFALDSNYVDQKQIQWLEKELAASGSDWKIAYFHHPLYSSGKTHGSADLQRSLIEPVFLKYGVNVVFTGHEHFYERIKPQKGVAYFIIGSSSKLRRGDLQKSALTVYGNDSNYAFMLVEIVGDELYFQTINDKGATIDTGSIRRVADQPPSPKTTTQPVVPQAKPSPVQPGPAKK
jgi:predicted MPP superfamily phosphohydrolase